jgi:hypothetical protein
MKSPEEDEGKEKTEIECCFSVYLLVAVHE